MSLPRVIADGASGLSPLFRHCLVSLTQVRSCLVRTLFVLQGQVLEMHDEDNRERNKNKQGILDGQTIICLCGCGLTMKGVHMIPNLVQQEGSNGTHSLGGGVCMYRASAKLPR